ncbi:MAG: hypothetical protein H6713_37415 [Myxococcales bacterium]|nr:hypothetical protein [Myxococcales bacterium]MCB9755644.1 hypothetical protein [Myxococcales bacterium]
MYDDQVTDSGSGGPGDDDSTAGTTGASTTQGPGGSTDVETTEADTTEGTGTEPEDEPPVACELSLNNESPQLVLNASSKLAIRICAEDDVALQRVELWHNGEPWLDYDFTVDEQKTKFQTTITIPIFSETLNEASPHEFELRVLDYAELEADPLTAELIVNLPQVEDANADVESLWTHTYENAEHDPYGSEYRDLVVDEEGNTFAVGYWISAMDEQTRHALLVKIPPTGGVQLCDAWNFFVGPGVTSSEAYAVDLTSAGDVIVVGASESLAEGVQNRLWIRKFNSDCEMDDTWVVNDQSETHTFALDVVVDPNDAIYVVGYEGVYGYSMSPLVRKYTVGVELPTAELADPQDYLKDHAARGVAYDPKRKLLFVTGDVTDNGPLDKRMMLMALKPALDQPQAVEVFAASEPALHSSGASLTVRADDTLLVVGEYRDNIDYGRAAVWRYDFGIEDNVGAFESLGSPILLKKSYGPGDEVATGVAVSPVVPFTGNNEWAVSLYAHMSDALTRGVVERRGIDNMKQWQYQPQPVARFQSIAFDCTGNAYVAGHWKVDDPATRPLAIVHKLP